MHCPPSATASMPPQPARLNQNLPVLPTRNLKISAVNINSITAPERLQELNQFVEDHKIDILAISELKIDSSVHSSLYSLSNFHRPVMKLRSRRGGGVALYVRSSLPFSHIDQLDNEDIEAIWIKVKLKDACILVCSVYLPPHATSETQQNFLDFLTDSVSLAQIHKPTAVLVAGDMNAGNCWLPNDHPHHSPITAFETKLRSTTEVLELSQLIDTATRIQNGTNNLRDLVFINKPELVADAGILPPFSNLDHIPTFVSLSLPTRPERVIQSSSIWDYMNTDIERLVQILSDTDWDAITNREPDEAAEILTTTILNAARQCIPVKIIRSKDNKPWVTSQLRREMRKRDRLFKIARNRQTEHAWARWRTQRNLVTSLNRNLKRDNLKRKISILIENKKDPFKYHSILKDISGYRRNDTIPPLIENDIILSDDCSKAQSFNAYFCAQTNLSLTDANREHLRDYINNQPATAYSLQSISVDHHDVIQVINSLDASKACGPDRLPTKILKMTAAFTAEPIAKLLNKSLAKGIYPSSWKKATVKPVYKGKGSPSDLKNYRPISLLPCISKIFEKIVFSKVYEHITTNDLLTERQSGYRSGHNTQLQLTYLIDKLYKSLDQGDDFTVLYLDISRYFEKIWHEGLLAKCDKEFGIRGKLLDWLRSYLSDRKQEVQVGTQKSDILTLSAGVPQGSVLGPLLAIMYLNGLSKLTSSGILLYADDSSLHATHNPNNIRQQEESLQKDLDAINDYSKQWAITFNASKTTQQTFSNRKGGRPPRLFFDDVLIPLSDTHKHLGLTISTDLRFKSHINETLLKFNRTLSPLYPIAPSIPRNMLLNIYTMYVKPHLDYCDAVYDGALSEFDKSRLEKAQKRAARLITGTPRRTPTVGLMKELGWSSLSERRHFHKLLLFHKLKFDVTVPDFIRAIIPNTRETDTVRVLRNTNCSAITLPQARTTLYLKSFVPVATKSWNDLPTNLRQQPLLSKFRKSLIDIMSPPKACPFFSFGSKKGNMMHTRIRLGASSLNQHRRALGGSVSSECSCGHAKEDTAHYLLVCPQFHGARREMSAAISAILNINFDQVPRAEQVSLLVYGPRRNKNIDKALAISVQNFLIKTRRFDN